MDREPPIDETDRFYEIDLQNELSRLIIPVLDF